MLLESFPENHEFAAFHRKKVDLCCTFASKNLCYQLSVPGKFFFGKVKGMTPDKEKEPQKGVWPPSFLVILMSRTVILDVGGERFVAMRSYLVKYPTTRLGRLMRASTIQVPCSCSCKPFIYEARESSFVTEGFLTAQFLQKL